jgi:hypothetical protein
LCWLDAESGSCDPAVESINPAQQGTGLTARQFMTLPFDLAL